MLSARVQELWADGRKPSLIFWRRLADAVTYKQYQVFATSQTG